jgi:hypothetical protein
VSSAKAQSAGPAAQRRRERARRARERERDCERDCGGAAPARTCTWRPGPAVACRIPRIPCIVTGRSAIVTCADMAAPTAACCT